MSPGRLVKTPDSIVRRNAMKKVDVSGLSVGAVAEHNYYSEKRELLIGKGATISDVHLTMLKRRNIFELFEDIYEHDEIMKIISTEILQLDEMDLPEIRNDLIAPVTPGTEPGKAGLEKLGQSKVALAIDRKLSERRIADQPTGRAIKADATQIAPGERSDEYKLRILDLYTESLNNTRIVLDALTGGNFQCASQIHALIEKMVKLFLTDKNILINIANTDPQDEDYIYHHSFNVCLFSINIAASFGYNHAQVLEIGIGALLHDIGMLFIPREIRVKHGRFNVEEWYEVQKHPIVGLHLLEKVKGLPESTQFIAYQIHERINAKGYPKQRGGRFIHPFAKLVQVADIYEALTSPRPHRKALLPYQAAEGLVKMTKTDLIADEFVKAFLSYISIFPIGSLVQLNNNAVAKVVDVNPQSVGKPVVAVLSDAQGKLLPGKKFYYINLRYESGTYITKALSSDFIKGIGIMDGF
jgi:HD-GYP domain-containing protein (c-di-GMP phosphodiesterase class II)